MAKPFTEQYVYLVPQRGEQNAVSWTWIYNGDSGPASEFPPIEVKKGSGKNDIYFTILDPQNQIKFAGYNGPDASKAIWLAEKQPGNPPKKEGIASGGEFGNIGFAKEGIQLVLDDKNGKKAEFVYQLNFVDSQTDQPVTSIDPEIRNGGGENPFDMFIDSAAFLIGGAVIGALVMYLIGGSRWGKRRKA